MDGFAITLPDPLADDDSKIQVIGTYARGYKPPEWRRKHGDAGVPPDFWIEAVLTESGDERVTLTENLYSELQWGRCRAAIIDHICEQDSEA